MNLTEHDDWFGLYFIFKIMAVNNLDLTIDLQSILQIMEEETSMFLGFINTDLKTMFGPDTNSFFVKTTPKNYLFDGIEFCSNKGSPIINTVCSIVAARNVNTIKKTDSGSLMFSFFNFVSEILN